MTAPAHLTPVPDDGLPVYPISESVRLDSHFFLMWNLKRWIASDFRRHGYKDPEVGFFGKELFYLAHGETPIGTLPVDDEALAFILRMPLTRWRELCSREFSPLYGWYRVQCDNGEIRLAHKVITEVVKEAIDGKVRNAAKAADDRMRKRLKTIADHLEKNIPGGVNIAANEERLNAISDWIDQAYPGGSATIKRVREAINDLSSRR